MSTEHAAGWAPRACTLPTSEQPLREAEFDELFASAVSGIERRGPGLLRLELDPTAPAAASSAGLLARETSCCSFFTFTLTATGDRLVLEVGVPPGQVEVLDGLAERAARLSARRGVQEAAEGGDGLVDAVGRDVAVADDQGMGRALGG